MNIVRALTLVLVVVAPGACAQAAAPHDQVKPALEQIQLPDLYGKPRTLAEFADKPVLVIAVLGTECPLAKLYAARLAELARRYENQGVAFLGIDANSQDSLSELSTFAARHRLPFPLWKDYEERLIDRLAAERTPEVFVLDAKRQVRYRGCVDDQYTTGQHRPAAKRHYLADAIDALLADEPIAQPKTDAVGCLIGRRPRRKPTGDVTYSNQIARVLQRNCMECHRAGQVAPMALDSFAEVVGWSEMIREVVATGRMPPWPAELPHGQFMNDRRMPADDVRLLETWIDNGCPEGDSRQLPPPAHWAEGWRIEKPDAVFYIADEAFDVPATGEVKYQYFTVDPGFTEDKWISAIEARPGNPEVVHHILAEFVGREPGHEHDFMPRPQVGYAPGLPPYAFPPGTAMYVPAGSQLSIQMHYTPNGVPQRDRSYIGVKFADPATVRHNVHCLRIGEAKFEIPPFDPAYVVSAEKRLKHPLAIISYTPHMHLRGKAFRYEAEYPDGRREVLFEIPRYDFHWQLRYELLEPKQIPAGSVLRCRAVFDNSEDNPLNPDPSKTVRWGDQTWEEMMLGYMLVLSTDKDGPAARN